MVEKNASGIDSSFGSEESFINNDVKYSNILYVKEYYYRTNNIILNIPHASTIIPKSLFDRSLIDQKKLADYAFKMADLYTDFLFEDVRFVTFKGKYSRLYCDLAKVYNPRDEAVSKIGMGVIYRHTYDKVHFNEYDDEYRDEILNSYYYPYHDLLNESVKEILTKHKKAIIIDCHSFCCNQTDVFSEGNYPDICLGFNEEYYDENMLEMVEKIIKSHGYSVKFNYPYAGSIIPSYITNQKRYDLFSLMINIKRSLYLNKRLHIKKKEFANLKQLIKDIYDYLLAYSEEHFN